MVGRAPRSRIFADRLPPVARGMRIGLFGGSFDPAHQGHRQVSIAALRRLKLDEVWWLVSPGNPLKPAPQADFARRMAEAAAIADHPRIVVTGVEEAMATRYAVHTLAKIMPRLRQARLVWLMGADNLAGFHRWRAWRRIAASLPLAIVDRPGSALRAIASPAGRAMARARLREKDARALAKLTPPAWVFLHGPLAPVSSTVLRSGRRP